MKFLRFIFLLLPLFLSGCFGLAVGTYGKHERLTTSFVLAKDKNHFLMVGRRSEPYTEAEIIQLWGMPDETASVGNCKVLKYRDGLSWSGVGAFVVIIPVPLLVPSGHYHNSFYLKEGKCVGLVSEYGEVVRVYGYLCGDNDGGFVAGEVKQAGPRKVPLDFCQ